MSHDTAWRPGPLRVALLAALGLASAAAVAATAPDSDSESESESESESNWSAARKRDGRAHWSAPLPPAAEGPQARRDGELLLLSNESLTALFDTGGQLLGIASRERGRDLLRAKPGGPVWRLGLGREDTQPERPIQNLDSRRAKPSIELSPGRLALEWRGLGDPPGLRVRVLWSLTQAGLEGRLLYDGASGALGVIKAVFPVVAGPGGRGAVDLVIPRRNWGERLEAFDGRQAGVYPSSSWNMQFLGLTDGVEALYVGAHDPEYFRKEFRIQAGRELALSLVPPRPGQPHRAFELPYSVVIDPVKGDWVALAKRYRRFALQSPAAARGRLVDRSDLERSFVEGLFWWLAWEPPDRIVRVFRRRLHRYGLPSALVWYGWYDIRTRSEKQGPQWECGLPDAIRTPRKGFARAVKELQELGVLVAPYVNAVSVDSLLPDYAAQLQPHAARDAEGRVVIRHWGCRGPDGPVPFAQMNPAVPAWRNRVLALIDQLREGYGIRAFYLDQMGGEPHLDFSRRAAHPPGGGNYWARGTQELLAAASRDGSRVLMEHPVDAYVPQTSAMLFYKSLTETMIPIHAAVYSDYRVAIGSGYGGPECARGGRTRCDSDLAVCAKLARAFLWGAQVPQKTGWLDRPEERAKLEFAARLVGARRQLADWLGYGEFLSPVELATREVDLVWWNHSVKGRREEVAVPAIQAAEWRSPDGTRAIVLVNWTHQTAKGQLTLPVAWNGRALELCDPDLACRAAAARELSLPAQSVRLVRAARAQAAQSP